MFFSTNPKTYQHKYFTFVIVGQNNIPKLPLTNYICDVFSIYLIEKNNWTQLNYMPLQNYETHVTVRTFMFRYTTS